MKAGDGAAYAAAVPDDERTVEPVQMVTTGRRWYLMAYDVDRQDWRTFRLDRMRAAVATTWRFRSREHPDPVSYVQQSVAERPYPHLARVRLRASAEHVRAQVPPAAGRVEEDGAGWCVLVAGAEDLSWLAVHVAQLGCEAVVLEPPELVEAAARLGRRLLDLADSGVAGSDR